MEIPPIRNIRKEILSDQWSELSRFTYEYPIGEGKWEEQKREVYNRGHGAAIFLYDTSRNTVLLTRQFRMACYVNNKPDAMMLEVCAGVLDGESPADCIIREVLEETGYRLPGVRKVFESYMSPGSVTEVLHFFIGEYRPSMKVEEGGGAEDESENIEVLEYNFPSVLTLMEEGKIRDAKTLMLLQYARIHELLTP